METDRLEIILRHLKHIIAVGQEDVTSLDILCHILVFAFLEILKFDRVITLNPAGLVQVHRLPTALCVVLVLETILYDLELELTNRSDELAPVMLIDVRYFCTSA